MGSIQTYNTFWEDIIVQLNGIPIDITYHLVLSGIEVKKREVYKLNDIDGPYAKLTCKYKYTNTIEIVYHGLTSERDRITRAELNFNAKLQDQHGVPRRFKIKLLGANQRSKYDHIFSLLRWDKNRSRGPRVRALCSCITGSKNNRWKDWIISNKTTWEQWKWKTNISRDVPWQCALVRARESYVNHLGSPKGRTVYVWKPITRIQQVHVALCAWKISCTWRTRNYILQ